MSLRLRWLSVAQMRWPFRGEVNEATFLGHASVTGLVAIPWHWQGGGVDTCSL
jgi:hypothetical protein